MAKKKIRVSKEQLEQSDALLTSLSKKIAEFEETNRLLEEDRRHYSEIELQLTQEQKKEIDRALGQVMALIKNGQIQTAKDASIALRERIDAETEEKKRKFAELKLKLQELIDQAKLLSTWFLEAGHIGRLSESDLSKAIESGTLTVTEGELDGRFSTLDTMRKSHPRLHARIKESYGQLRSGSWGTIQVIVKNESDFPVEVTEFKLPSEFKPRQEKNVSKIDANAERIFNLGLLPEVSGTLPANVSILYSLPWDQHVRADERVFAFEHIFSVQGGEPAQNIPGALISAKSETTNQDAHRNSVGPKSSAVSNTTCHSCGKLMRQGWKKCPFCGTPTQELSSQSSLCPSCGKPVKENWKKCPYCATSIR